MDTQHLSKIISGFYLISNPFVSELFLLPLSLCHARCYNGAARYVPPLPPKSCLGNPPSGMRKAHALRRTPDAYGGKPSCSTGLTATHWLLCAHRELCGRNIHTENSLWCGFFSLRCYRILPHPLPLSL
jgi:hypothetical protein